MTEKKELSQARGAAAKQEAEGLEANSALPTLSESDKAAAQKDGIKDAVKEAAKDSYQYLTDGQLLGEEPGRQWHGKDDIMQWEPLLSLGIDEFAARIADNAEGVPVPEEKVAGLLELERSGKNRTDYVKAMCKRLDVKSPYEVTSAGPDYTNDTTPVTKL